MLKYNFYYSQHSEFLYDYTFAIQDQKAWNTKDK